MITRRQRRVTMKQVVISVVVAVLTAYLLLVTQAEAAQTWITCTPVDIATYSGRVHVLCAAPVGGISFFAVSTQNSAHAARVLSVISTAQVAGRTLKILYDPADHSGAGIGCVVTDCRLIIAVGFGR
jgi:hypothetical protein